VNIKTFFAPKLIGITLLILLAIAVLKVPSIGLPFGEVTVIKSPAQMGQICTADYIRNDYFSPFTAYTVSGSSSCNSKKVNVIGFVLDFIIVLGLLNIGSKRMRQSK